MCGRRELLLKSGVLGHLTNGNHFLLCEGKVAAAGAHLFVRPDLLSCCSGAHSGTRTTVKIVQEKQEPEQA